MLKSQPWFRVVRNQWYVTLNAQQVPLGVFGPENQAAAVAALQQLLAAMAGQTSGATRVAPETVKLPTVRDSVNGYLLDRTGRVKPKTISTYRWYLEDFAKRFGSRIVGTVTPREIEDDALARDWSDDSRRNYLAIIEGWSKWAKAPLKLDKPGRGSAGAETVLTEETFKLAVASASGDLRPLLTALWHTGARPSELTSLTAEAVNWESATATLRTHKTSRKTGRPRLLVFPPPAMEVLAAQRAKWKGRGLLFRSQRGTAFTCPGLTQAVWRVGKRIGRKLTAYGFRHTFATDALVDGIPDTHVAALMGHAGTAMIHKHYSHVNQNARLLHSAASKIRGGETTPL